MSLSRCASPRLPAPLARVLPALVLSVLALCGVVLGAPGTARAAVAHGPTPHQEAVVLRLIDDICGDTWCEGDHAFRFRGFDCQPAAQTCRLTVGIAPYSDGPLRWYPRSGLVRGFVHFRDMVTTAPDGARSLTPAFYAAVDDLVGRLEATVPPARASAP